MWLVSEFAARITVPGTGRRQLYDEIAGKLGCVWQTVKRIVQQKDFWLEWGQRTCRKGAVGQGSFRKQGQRHSAWAGRGASKGCRVAVSGAALGRPNPCQQMVDQVRVWAEVEQENGHELSRQDLLRQFRLYLDSAIHEAVDKQEARTLPPEGLRQTRLDESSKARERCAQSLLAKTGFVERKKQRTTALTVQEEVGLVEEGWQNFDYLLWKTGCSSPAELRDFVAQPERFVVNRQHTVISMSDQVRVWLKADSGKCLMPLKTFAAVRQAKRRRTSRAVAAASGEQTEGAAEQPRTLVCAAGNRANSRARYTLVARQLIYNYYKPDRDPYGDSLRTPLSPTSSELVFF